MKLFKNVVLLLMMMAYGYGQSVFSHLAIMNGHHEVDNTAVHHIHEHDTAHEHIEQGGKGCDDIDCETTCTSIEQSKIIASYKHIHITVHNWHCHQIVYISTDTNPSGTHIGLAIDSLGPPIPYESIASRIGVIVRII